MRRRIKKPRSLKLRFYAERLIDLNNYLAYFPGADFYGKMGITYLNGILLNIMPNIWSKKVYVQGFGCESILFKKSVNVFEIMEISESIYKGVVEPSY